MPALNFVIVFVITCFTLLLVRCLCLILFKKQNSKKNETHVKTIIVIGSGGHTAEMLRQVTRLKSDLYRPRMYIMASSDTSSENKIKEVEKNFQSSDDEWCIKKIYRITGTKMALKGIKVVELAGLAPGPFCGMVLSDFGASVIRVDKVLNDASNLDSLGNGKKSIALNLKHKRGLEVFKKLCNRADVLIEPFRKGVMEKLGLGPDILFKENPKLIYARLSGFGQTGAYSSMAGHDINYVATSGLLSLLGRKSDKPMFPVNLLADFGGGGLMCALGIIMSLLERTNSGLGQVVDCAMVDGTAYLGSWVFRSQNLPIWGQNRGENVLDSGSHFYEVYETKDKKYMAVGALEHQFYKILLEKLNLTEEELPQYGDFENSKKILTDIFQNKTQDEWCEIFDGSDACVTPVLSFEQVSDHKHNNERKTFNKLDGTILAPNPAPFLSRTPAVSTSTQPAPKHGQHTIQILNDLGYSQTDIDKLVKEVAVEVGSGSSKL